VTSLLAPGMGWVNGATVLTTGGMFL